MSIFALANAGPNKPAVALHTHSTAGQQIGHSGNCFFCALGAGTNSKDEIAEGKLRAGFQDKGILFH